MALSDTCSLRGYYTPECCCTRWTEEHYRVCWYLRYVTRPGLNIKRVDKIQGRWIELDQNHNHLVNQDYAATLDAKRLRNRDVIVQMLFDEVALRRVYTDNQFAVTFERYVNLGANRTINERISVLERLKVISSFSAILMTIVCPN